MPGKCQPRTEPVIMNSKLEEFGLEKVFVFTYFSKTVVLNSVWRDLHSRWICSIVSFNWDPQSSILFPKNKDLRYKDYFKNPFMYKCIAFMTSSLTN